MNVPLPALPGRQSPDLGRRTIAFRLDFSWLPTGALLLWWMATRTVPAAQPMATPVVWWLVALAVFVGFVASVIAHEIWHEVVAGRYGFPGETVRLYPFGGARGQGLGPSGAEGDFIVALAGPVASATIAFILLVIAESLPPESLGATGAGHLAGLNAALAVINLLPAYPLDAGRALRAVIWALKGDFGFATGLAARLGSVFGLAAVALGILIILGDNAPVLGVALLLFGFTLRTAAVHSHRHMVARSSLAGVPVRRFMDENPITVQRALSITSLAEDFIYKHHLSMLPVVDGDKLLGYVTAQRVRELPRDEWSRQSIGTIILPFSSENTVSPDTDAVEALDKMTSTGNTRLMVVERGRLAGVVALQDLGKSLQPEAAPEAGTP